MRKEFIAIMKSVMFIVFLLGTSLWAQQGKVDQGERHENNPSYESGLTKTYSVFDRGVAHMNAGKMHVNGVENWGMIGQLGPPFTKHGFWGEMRWIIFFVAIPPGPWGKDIVDEDGRTWDRSDHYMAIESLSSRLSGSGEQGITFSDWEAQDRSMERLMGIATDPSGRPLLATSTLKDSWPEGYFNESGDFVQTPGERHWPGRWAIDPDPESPTYGQEVEGQFVSSQDVYFIMDDKYHGIRADDQIGEGYPIGLDVNAALYAYAAPIYEDVVFFNYNLIFRTKGNNKDPGRRIWDGPIDSVYVGFFIDPDLPGRAPDGHTMDPWAYDDYAIFDTERNIFIMYDKDGWDRDEDDDNDEGPVSAYSIGLLKTPTGPDGKEVGLTGYHFFDQENGMTDVPPGADRERNFYAMAAGLPELLPPEDAARFFHGPDPHFDSLDSLRSFQELPGGASKDTDVFFLISAGP
ncbi:MAG: hypothetical protein ACE5H0_08280, partial [Bacteroidota bacterium]